MPTYAFPTTTAGDHHRQQTPTHTSHSHRHSQSHSYSVSHVSSASQSHWPVDPHTRVNAHGLPFDYASEHAHINGLNFYNLSENLSEPDWIGGTSAAAESSAMYLSHMPQHQSHVMGHTNMDLASAYSNQPHQSNQHLGAPSQEILRQSLSAEDLTSTHCYTGYETSTSNDGSHYDYPGYFHSNCLSPSPATSPPGSSVQGGQIIAAQRNCPFRCPFYLNSPGDYPQCRDLTFRFMSRIR